ncbi:MAG: 50S ribosomal protein L4 [Oscillospiraceae bacterium]|jgi:large subunit ribosomal protein L4|nr:50S ribosomal protein L4 [Oscillospiraceae bacterium]
MPTVPVKNQQGVAIGEIALSEEIFGADINRAAIHLVVRSQLAAKRQGTQSAKTRGEVRGGGRKIYRQKGTGNARHHSNRAPQFTHGGVAFAPKPRDYVINVPRKVRRLALKGVLTSKAQDGAIIVLDKLALDAPKTRLMVEVLAKLAAKKPLLVLSGRDETVVRASANIPGLQTAYVNTINVLDILGHETFIITQDAVKLVEEVYAQ